MSGIGAGLPTFDGRVPPDLARAWLALAEEISAEERTVATTGMPAALAARIEGTVVLTCCAWMMSTGCF